MPIRNNDENQCDECNEYADFILRDETCYCSKHMLLFANKSNLLFHKIQAEKMISDDLASSLERMLEVFTTSINRKKYPIPEAKKSLLNYKKRIIVG